MISAPAVAQTYRFMPDLDYTDTLIYPARKWPAINEKHTRIYAYNSQTYAPTLSAVHAEQNGIIECRCPRIQFHLDQFTWRFDSI